MNDTRTASWLDSAATQRKIGRLAWAAAWFGLVGGQLHALARHQTADGREDLELPLTRGWSDPAREALRPLLDWADVDTVYLTYGKLWIPVFVALTLCAFVVHRRRRPVGFERWAWRLALTGYWLATVSVAVEYGTSWTGYAPWFEGTFVVLAIPGLLLTLLGSTVLGITLVRRGLRPRGAAWLLTLVVPIGVVVGQFTSMGSLILPVAFAFGILGRRIAQGQASPEPHAAPASSLA